MKKGILVLYLTFGIFGLFLSNVNADTFLHFETTEILDSGTLADGVTYEQIEGISYTDEGTPGNQNVSVVRKQLNSSAFIATWSVLSSQAISGSTVLRIAQDYELNHPGYEVLAAINGDYFNSTGYIPINSFVQDGITVKATNFYLPRYFSIGFTNDSSLYVKNKDNDTVDNYSLVMTDTDGKVVFESEIQGFNQIPEENQVSVYYKALNSLTVLDAKICEVAVIHRTEFDVSMIHGEITALTNEITTDETKAYIVSKSPEMNEYIQAGFSVHITKRLSGVNRGIKSVMGVGSQPLVDGEILDFEDINDQSEYFAKVRNPRSSVGFTADGTFVIATVDGRQQGSEGVNLREEAKIMKLLGCEDAFNFDGGGSTQLVIKKNDEFIYLNQPSEMPARRVCNAILIVQPRFSVSLNVENITSNSFDYSVVQADQNNIQGLEVYLNGVMQQNVIGDTVVHVESSHLNSIDWLSLLIHIEGEDHQIVTYTLNQRVELEKTEEEENPSNYQEPSDFTLRFDSSCNHQLCIYASFLDPSQTVTKLYLQYGDQKRIFSKTTGGEYLVEIDQIEKTTTFEFKLAYTYISSSFHAIDKVDDNTYYYTYSISENVPPAEPNAQNDFMYAVIGGAVIILFVGGTFILYRYTRKTNI